MLFSSAYASVSPVPDSSPQSDNWLQYEKAEGKGVSGASIMKDNPQDEGLNSKWIHDEGYTSTSQTVKVPSVTWVQSSEQITVTDQPGHYETVTDPGYWKATKVERFYFNRFVAGTGHLPPWIISDKPYFDEPVGTSVQEAEWDFYNKKYATQFPSWYPYPLGTNQFIVSRLTIDYPKYGWSSWGYGCIGTTELVYDYLDSATIQNLNEEGHNVIGIMCDIQDPQPITHQEWVPPVTHQVYVPPVTHVETKDTSHWVTTYTTQTIQDYEYSKSPHWSPYEGYIPQYELKKEGDLQ
jgi:hypothetical protein